ncbi:MAG: transcriptional repressor LexA [Oscillospiraceae bacterium]|nr:transcriptional repressor LexA [Oscillospiraceae bacterium]
MNLHRKQVEIHKFLIEFTEQNGYPPSVREICSAVNLKSPSTVHSHLRKIEAAGLISIDNHKTRAIKIEGQRGGVPIIGRVTAGSPILAFEQEIGVLQFSPSASGEHFALEVSGDSMINAGILDGDYVVVRKQHIASHGEIVVALLEDEATVKRLWRKDGKVQLMPENPDYDPIEGDTCQILGRVTAVVREI